MLQQCRATRSNSSEGFESTRMLSANFWGRAPVEDRRLQVSSLFGTFGIVQPVGGNCGYNRDLKVAIDKG